MYEFLNSKFAIFLMGSVALPAILAFWEYLKTRATRRNVMDRLARLAIWRYTLVEDGCKGNHPGFLHAFAVLRGGSDYRQLDPKLENDRPLAGLVLQLMPKKELQARRPGRISRLMELESILYYVAVESDRNFEKREKEKHADLDRLLREIREDQEYLISLVQ
jgi:hypothetical protein